jgi:HEAT repeat protein
LNIRRKRRWLVGKAIDYRRHLDPEYRRWGRKYTLFPGVAECVRLLRAGNVRGAWVDIIALELAAHASECLPELVTVFRTEESEWVRQMVLMAVAQARLPAAIPFLAEVAQERHPRFTTYAEQGLSDIGTSQARAALWRATHAERGAAANRPRD